MLKVFGVGGLPEFVAGDDLAQILGDALEGVVEAGDILAVTSKVVSKVEGRQVLAADVVELIGAMDGVRQVAGGEPLHQHAHAGAGIAEVHMQVP